MTSATDGSGPGKGVVVLGMHRSGTSAVTGLLHLAGVPLPDRRYLVGRGKFNPKGFWEIQPLNILNESLLRTLGGDWSTPPHLEEGWAEERELRGLKERSRKVFSSIMPRGAWLWKDPRLCLTLPFWRDVVGPEPVIFIVLRNPIEIARSLKERNGFPQRLSLALWEQYTASATKVSSGGPVAVLEYQSVFSDPVGWAHRAREWVVGHGVGCGPMSSNESIEELIDPGLRHGTATPDDLRADADASPQQVALLDRTLDRRGFHDAFIPPELPEPTPWARALVEERRPTRSAAHRHHRWRKAVGKQAARLVRRRTS